MTVGYGHGAKTWRDITSALRSVGYDYVMSIEHEDGLASGALTTAVTVGEDPLGA
jgi:sugar phosphate isomerase/epimerase